MSEVPHRAPTLESSPSPLRRRLAALIIAGAMIVGGAAYVFAGHYDRPGPAAEPPMPGVAVRGDTVAVSRDAPAWNVLQVAHPSPPAPQWTDPIPARIVFDEGRTSRLGSPLAGRVTAVMAVRGQHVKAGAPLFTISSQSLAELRSESARAEVERKTARIDLERVQALVDAGAMPAKELVAAQQRMAEADLAVNLAAQKLASLKIVGNDAASFTVQAPRDGVVVEKDVAVGQEVDSTTASLLAIADLSEVWVVADLFQGDVGRLAPGAAARVSLDGAATIDGKVEQVSAVVDPDRHTVPVRVRLANPDGALRPNAFAQVQFLDPTAARGVVPASAVLSDGVHSYVYVMGDGVARRRDVTVGPSSGGKVPILAGLDPSDQVVTKGAILLDNQIQLDD